MSHPPASPATDPRVGDASPSERRPTDGSAARPEVPAPRTSSISGAGGAPRLMLVEVAATDRFHRAVAFPYLLGRARAAGVQAAWWRYAVPAHTGATRPALLDEGALNALVERARTYGASHVLVGGSGIEPLARRLADALGHVTVAAEEALGGLGAGGDPLGAWLGLGALPPAPPDFGFEPAHAAAAETAPLPFVVLGPECTFNLPLARNPAFAGVELASCVRQGGCSFCARPADPRGRRPLDTEDLASQLAALEHTLPRLAGAPERLAVRFVGEPALDGADEVARAVARASLGAVDILLDGRADQLVRRRAVLETACRALEGTPHRVHMALVGVESFSRDELLRMNKGLVPQDNLDAARTLMELEREPAGRFRFREHGGLSLITMTPWTTLDDLATTLHTVRGARLEGVVGKLLSGRVRLTPGLPMTALAARDGLLLDKGASYEDQALDTAAHNLYAAELPWRFAEPRMEAVSRLLVRLGEPGLARGEDPLAEPVAALREAAGRGAGAHTELAAAIAVVDAARSLASEPKPPTGAALASAAGKLLRHDELPDERLTADALELAVALARAGLKPVTKREPLTRREAAALVHRLRGVAAVQVRERRGPQAGWEAFVGVDAAVVARVAELTGRAEEGAGDDGAAQDEIGRLLGYPPCCAAAFSRDLPSASRDHYSWLHVARRVAAPGPVSALTSPWAGHLTRHYVPCSATCAETRRRAEAAHEVFREVFGEEAARAHERAVRHPWLVALGGESLALELVPTATPTLNDGGGFIHYTAGSTVAPLGKASWALALAARGDTLVLDGERTVVLARGKRLGELTSRAFVWWHHEALQAQWWQRLTALRGLAEARMDQETAPERSDGAATAPWLEELRRAVHRALGDGGVVGWEVKASGPRAATLRLRRGGLDVRLAVEGASVGRQALFGVGPWAFSHPPGEPLDTAAKRSLVRAVGRALRATWRGPATAR